MTKQLDQRVCVCVCVCVCVQSESEVIACNPPGMCVCCKCLNMCVCLLTAAGLTSGGGALMKRLEVREEMQVSEIYSLQVFIKLIANSRHM